MTKIFDHKHSLNHQNRHCLSGSGIPRLNIGSSQRLMCLSRQHSTTSNGSTSLPREQCSTAVGECATGRVPGTTAGVSISANPGMARPTTRGHVQQPTAPQYQYQYSPRPWGSMTGPNSNQNSNVSTETWPQGGYVAPWGMPQTGGNLGGAPAGQPGQPPGTVYYDSIW